VKRLGERKKIKNERRGRPRREWIFFGRCVFFPLCSAPSFFFEKENFFSLSGRKESLPAARET